MSTTFDFADDEHAPLLFISGCRDRILTAWAPDGTAKPVSGRLSQVTIPCG